MIVKKDREGEDDDKSGSNWADWESENLIKCALADCLDLLKSMKGLKEICV